MGKRLISFFVITAGIFLVGSAVFLTCFNIWDNSRAGETAGNVLKQIEKAENPKKNSDNAIPDYVLNPKMDMPVIVIDGHRYIGTVDLPVLDIKLPVMEEWSYPNMRTAPCRYKGSAYLNNMIICGHNYASHLGRLQNLRQGDSVIFTDVDGNEFKYTVKNIELLSKTAVEEMESGIWDLTLFTCTVDGQTRVTVRCSKK